MEEARNHGSQAEKFQAGHALYAFSGCAPKYHAVALFVLGFSTAPEVPFAATASDTGPPGESANRAVRTSTPVSVTSSVCSAAVLVKCQPPSDMTVNIPN